MNKPLALTASAALGVTAFLTGSAPEARANELLDLSPERTRLVQYMPGEVGVGVALLFEGAADSFVHGIIWDLERQRALEVEMEMVEMLPSGGGLFGYDHYGSISGDLFLPADDDEKFKYTLLHVMFGTIDGVKVELAEVRCYMDRFLGRDEPLHSRYPKRCTVVLVARPDLDLSEFRLQPENRLTRMIEKEQAALSLSDFNRVVGPDPEAIVESFNQNVRDRLARNRARTIVGKGTTLMLYHRETQLSARRCRGLMAFGVDLIRQFQITESSVSDRPTTPLSKAVRD